GAGDSEPGFDHRPHGHRRRRGEPHDEPHHGLDGSHLGRAAHDSHQERRRDDVAEAEEPVGDDQAGERRPSATGGRHGGAGARPDRSGMVAATTAPASMDTSPAASQSARQPRVERIAARTASIATPVPTPAKWSAASRGRPTALSRSSTRAEEKTRPKALATPPTKRRTKNAAMDEGTAIPAVVRAPTMRAAISQRRRDP